MMTIPSATPHSSGTPYPEATGRPPRPVANGVAVGDIACIRADKGFAARMPDGNLLKLDGQLVLVLDERFDTVDGKRSRLLQFRPIPWTFPESAYPSAWWAVEGYFHVVQR